MQIQGLSSIQPQAVRQLQSSAPLAGVYPGDKIKAEVTSVENGRVTLSLPDGTSVKANTLANETLRPGDSLLLEVQGSSGQGTSLKLMEVNGQALHAEVPTIDYTLMRMNVTPDSTRVAFARVLQDLGLTLSPDALKRMGTVLKNFPDMPAASAALFAASDLAITEENIKAFQLFAQKPAQAAAFSNEIARLIEENPGMAKMLVALQAADGGAAQAGEGGFRPPAGLSEGTAALISQSGDWQKLMQDAPRMNDTQARAAMLELFSTLGADASASDKRILLAAFMEARQALTPDRTQSGAQPGTPSGAQSTAQPETLSTAQPETLSTAQPATQSTAQPATQSTAQSTAQPAAQPGDQLNAAQPGLAQTQAVPLERVVRSMFALLERGDMESAGKLKDSASGLMSRVAALSGALEELGGAHAKGAAQLGNTVVTQLQMGNELHNLYYAQIPFMLGRDDERSGELYVLKRDKSGKQIDEANATIALCLETQTMGRLESLLHVEQNELSLQFRVEGEGVRRFVKEQLYRLRELDFPAQYHLGKMNVVLQKEPVTPVNAAKTMKQAFHIQQAGTLDVSV